MQLNLLYDAFYSNTVLYTKGQQYKKHWEGESYN